jgi:hypothetical protein
MLNVYRLKLVSQRLYIYTLLSPPVTFSDPAYILSITLGLRDSPQSFITSTASNRH